MLSWLGALGLMFLYFVGSLLAAVLIRAAVLQLLWDWFVVEQFALAPLSFYMAAGLIATALIVQGLSESLGAGWQVWHQPDEDEETDGEGEWDDRRERMQKSLVALLMTHVLGPLAILALGWVLKQGL